MKGKEGKIYILRNPYHKDAIVKIGRTSRISEERAREISGGTGVPAEFEVIFEEDVFDCHLAEKIIHEKLNEERINPKREFFHLPLKKAVKTVFETCLEINKNSLKVASTRLIIAVNENHGKNLVKQLMESLVNHRGGKVSVYFLYVGENAKALLQINKEWNISLSPELINKLKKLKGVDYVLWLSRDLDNFNQV